MTSASTEQTQPGQSPFETGSLSGYLREDGRYGIRNLVAVMAAADNVNPLARRLSALVGDVVVLPASYGRGQLGRDLELTLTAMAGLAAHPNLFACLIVSFDRASAERIAHRVSNLGRSVRTLSLLEEGGLSESLARGRAMLSEMKEEAANIGRSPMLPKDVILGSECGGSDITSGQAANPALGQVVDALLAAGGRAVFSEPVECLGVEDKLRERAVSSDVAEDMLRRIQAYQDIARKEGIDLTGINPTADNIAGGLKTIEQKSLGALAKTGTGPIAGVLDYGCFPTGPGLWFMDAPAPAVENMTALAAGGCQVILFSSGSANPVGHPLAPTLKVVANPETGRRMGEHIDVDLSGFFTGAMTIENCGRKVMEAVLKVINGGLTAAERLDYLETNISRIGPSV